MSIYPLDISDDGALSNAYLIECAANEQARPGWLGIGAEARALGWRANDGWTNHLIGAWDHTTLLGFAASMTSDDVPDTTWIFTWVHPEHQGRGLGTALVRAAEKESPQQTTRFVTSAYRRTLDEIAALENHFVGPLGYTAATTETVVELDLQSSRLVHPAAIDGYTVSTYINGVPERFREQVGQLKGLVDAEAPNGELGWSETTVSPAEYASEIDLWVAQRSTVIESIAVDSDGDVAAWTCLVTANTANKPAHIEGTLVLNQHRGHGLGAAVKLASLDSARALGNIQFVRTSSDDQNTWMRSINAAIGFVPVETEVLFQKIRTAAE
ncbi:Acetyltransferase (GNAT) family protein [Arthrobacter alpinus]|uniref:Acetyltransferase (GNAT) family protein n=1 Tax=Arthrobacter alpinus TaxID=656366 RepID=A0A1H5P9V5_9MICC|nr:GNAT family N-acetyltransferase [Arthrobacter alpinus]SEF10703.1 Acetyltransferase (GNAT) family protein [Arthrobacter alpinus]